MSVRAIPLFDPDGYATPFLNAQWRQKGAQRALQVRAVLVTSGEPTAIFRGFWAAAFPARETLPVKVADADGTGSDEFWAVFR